MTDYRKLLEQDLRLAGPAGFSLHDLARRRSVKRRNQRIGTAALALVLAAAALGFLVRAFQVDRSPRPADLPTTPDAWSRHQVGEMRIGGITAGGPGLVAVGWDERGAAAWTSSDGETWDRVPQEELGPGTINDVTAAGPSLVAVGTTDNELARIQGTQSEGPSHGVVWTSEDGRTWTRIPDDPVIRGAAFGPSDITTGGPGVVAVGAQNAAWFSFDGIAWEPASVPPVPEDVYPGDDGRHPQVYMTDVASSGNRLLALGTALLKGGGPPPEYETWVPTMWTSVDGTSWRDMPVDPEVFPREGSIDALTDGPGGFVAVGSDGDGPAVWRSADGLGWHRVSSDAFASRVALPGRSSAMWSVAASEGGYVAVGVDGACLDGIECRSAEAAIWTSNDGESWVRVPPGDVFRVAPDPGSEGSQAWQVVAWGSRFVVEGQYDGRDAIWISG
jgi:hypothetical protein